LNNYSGFYEVAGGTYNNDEGYIYPILDWKSSPGWAVVTSIGGMIFAILGHIVFSWGSYRLRILIVNKHLSRNTIAPSTVHSDASLSTPKSNNFAYSNPTPVDHDERKGWDRKF